MSDTPRRRFARRAIILGVLPVLAIMGLVVPRAFAGRWGWGGRCGHHAASTPEEMRERMQYGAERILDRVDATDQQRAAFDQMIEELAPDAVTFQGEKRELAKQMHAALAADKVDVAELERIRGAGIELAER